MSFGERSRAATSISAGGTIGTVITFGLFPLMVEGAMTWVGVFYIPAGGTLLWAVLWVMFVTSAPETNKFVAQEELDRIIATRSIQTRLAPDSSASLGAVVVAGGKPLLAPVDADVVEDGGMLDDRGTSPAKASWKRIFKTTVFYSATMSSIVQCFGFYTLLTFLPQYMEYQMGQSLQSSGLLSVLPFLCQIFGKMIAGLTADGMMGKWGFRVSTTRKTMSAISSFVPGISLVFVPSTSDPSVAIALFAVAMFAQGFEVAGDVLAISDIFEEQVGLAFGIFNGVGSLAGAIAPIVVGQLTAAAGCSEDAGATSSPSQQHKCSKAWAMVFYLSAGLFTFGGVQFIIFGGMDPAYRRDRQKVKGG
jgi:nitrate/nitrite transporter NarK